MKLEYDKFNRGRTEVKPITKGGCASVTNGIRDFCLWAVKVYNEKRTILRAGRRR